MRPSSRLARRWNSTLFLFLAQSNLARVLFYAGKLDEADAVARKRRVAAIPLLPVIDGRCSSLLQRGDARRPCGKLNWSLTKAFAVSTCARALCARRSSRRRRGSEPTSSRRSETVCAIKSLRFTPCEARKTKLSSGCKSRLMITTVRHAEPSVDPLLRGLRGDPRYKACWKKWVCQFRYEYWLDLRASTCDSSAVLRLDRFSGLARRSRFPKTLRGKADHDNESSTSFLAVRRRFTSSREGLSPNWGTTSLSSAIRVNLVSLNFLQYRAGSPEVQSVEIKITNR